MPKKIYERNIKTEGFKVLCSFSNTFFKRSAGINVVGDPDIWGVYRGRHIEIEVKRPGGKVTPIQAAKLLFHAENLSIVGIAECREDFENIIKIIKKNLYIPALYIPKKEYTRYFSSNDIIFILPSNISQF